MSFFKISRREVFLVILLLLLLFSFLFIIFLSSIFTFKSPQDETFQLQQVSVYQNTSSSELLTMNQNRVQLSDHQFLSFTPDSHSALFLSKFSSTSFECLGSCHCSTNSRRSTVLTRSLSLLLAAFSSSVAMLMAKEAFQNQCIHQFSQTCDPEDISSEVSSCQEKEDSPSNKKNEIPDELLFYCDGCCVPKPEKMLFHDTEESVQKEILESWKFINDDCRLQRSSSRVRILRKLSEDEVLEARKGRDSRQIPEYLYRLARDEFIPIHLSPHCGSASRLSFSGSEVEMCGYESDVLPYKNNVKCRLVIVFLGETGEQILVEDGRSQLTRYCAYGESLKPKPEGSFLQRMGEKIIEKILPPLPPLKG